MASDLGAPCPEVLALGYLPDFSGYLERYSEPVTRWQQKFYSLVT